MNRADTLAFLNTLFTATPAAATHYTNALAPTIDSDGRAPVDPEWVETFDEWLTAANVARTLALYDRLTGIDPTVTQVTSEGTTMTISPGVPVDWDTVADMMAARSPLASSVPGVGVWGVDPGPDYRPRSLGGWPL